jgi:hypothetical protein
MKKSKMPMMFAAMSGKGEMPPAKGGKKMASKAMAKGKKMMPAFMKKGAR